MQDLGNFIIPYTIGNFEFGKALCDSRVSIKVGKFIFPVDFVVMDMEEDTQVPMLLVRPFLAIRAALIDVKKGELTLRVGDEAVHFNLNQSLKVRL